MKRAILAAAAAIVLPLAFASCDKEKDVYATGYDMAKGQDNVEGEPYRRFAWDLPMVAAVWKNGALLHRLGDGVHVSCAYSIFVSGGDVYATGMENVADPHNELMLAATVWKNGDVLRRLGGERSGSHSIHVSGKDVYVAGHDDGGKIWKNDVEHSRGVQAFHALGKDVYAAVMEKADDYNSVVAVQKNGITLHRLGDGSRRAKVASIWVSGEDVYAAGSEETAPHGRVAATVWKNGAALRVGDAGEYDNRAESVYVSGKDVYVCVSGHPWRGESGEGSVAVWKNGAVVQRVGLGHDHWSNFAYVRVSGGDTYLLINVGSTKGRTPMVWKNGAELPGVDAFCVSGGDVYMAGHDEQAGDALTIWKNGKVKHRLPKGEPRANVYAIFVE